MVSARRLASVGCSLHLVAMLLAVPIGATEAAGPQESCRAVSARGQESCLATHPTRSEGAFVCDAFVNSVDADIRSSTLMDGESWRQFELWPQRDASRHIFQ